MADISHMPTNRHARRADSSNARGGLASLTAHVVFTAAVVFAVAIVLGLVN
jgi:hypothetical protein